MLNTISSKHLGAKTLVEKIFWGSKMFGLNNLSKNFMKRTDLENETVEKVIEILKAEFE